MQPPRKIQGSREKLIAQGKAYRCWASKEDLDAMRERQRSRGEKPRYDGRWRPERAKAAGLVRPADRAPVVRFRNPDEGDVVFPTRQKARSPWRTSELDDLVCCVQNGVRPVQTFGSSWTTLDMKHQHTSSVARSCEQYSAPG